MCWRSRFCDNFVPCHVVVELDVLTRSFVTILFPFNHVVVELDI